MAFLQEGIIPTKPQDKLEVYELLESVDPFHEDNYPLMNDYQLMIESEIAMSDTQLLKIFKKSRKLNKDTLKLLNDDAVTADNVDVRLQVLNNNLSIATGYTVLLGNIFHSVEENGSSITIGYIADFSILTSLVRTLINSLNLYISMYNSIIGVETQRDIENNIEVSINKLTGVMSKFPEGHVVYNELNLVVGK